MKNIIFSVLIAIMIILTCCTSTKITNSWREPDKQVFISKLNKVLIVALLEDETSRRKAEDQMAGYLKGKGVVSYNYLSFGFNENNEAAIRNKIRIDGFDGAITMRLVDVDRDKTYVSGNLSNYPSYNRSFSLYYIRNFQYFSNTSYYATTKTYTVEINVYSIKEDKLIWTGITKTTNPDEMKKMTKEIAKVVYKKMSQEGFIGE